MAGTGGAVQNRGLSFNATVLSVQSPTAFVCNLKGYGTNFFQGWDVWVVRKADGTGAPPQGSKAACIVYTNDGAMSLKNALGTASLSVGDSIYLLQPYISENVMQVDQPSDNLKQSSNTEVSTSAIVYTLVKSLVFAGAVGAARIKFNLRVNAAGGTARAVIYHNSVPVVTNPAGAPIYTVWSDSTGVYQLFTQDISGLSAGDTIQIYAEVANPANTAYVRNFGVYYDIVNLPTIQAVQEGVYVDTVNGVGGTAFPIGTKTQPVNNWADAQTILRARNLFDVYLNHGAITLTADIAGYHFHGNGFSDNVYTPAFIENCIEQGGFNATGCSFEKINVHDATGLGQLISCGVFLDCSLILGQSQLVQCSGFINCDKISATTITSCFGFINCTAVYALSAFNLCVHFVNCGQIYTVTLNNCYEFVCCPNIVFTTAVGCLYFNNCTFVKSVVSPTMRGCTSINKCMVEGDLTLDLSSSSFSVEDYEFVGGAITVINLLAALTINIAGACTVTVAASCTGGTINVYGNIHLVNNSGGATVNNYTTIGGISSTPIPDWSPSQLTATIPAIAGTLALPSVVVAGIPAGATIAKARAILTSRIIYNTNAALNKLNGATVAGTSQVLQIQKGAGAWVDCINFIDDQFQQAGGVSEGGVFVPGTIDLSGVITGNDTYNFRWLLARADLDAIVLQGVKIAIQYSYHL